MSHQDNAGDSGSHFNHQSLKGALDWLLSKSCLASIGFREDCTWTPRALVMCALLWVWSDEKTLHDRFSKARKIACRMCPWLEAPAKSYQAFIKLLQHWTGTLAEAVRNVFRAQMQKRLPDRFRIAGFIPFAVDGSRFALPRTLSHEQAYTNTKKKKRKKAKQNAARKKRMTKKQKAAARAHQKKVASPQLWITTLWHLGCGLPWAWRLGPSDSSEREHMRQMMLELPSGALLVADAGFASYDLWQSLVALQCQLVMRVGSNVRLLRKLGYSKQRHGLVYLWPNRAAAKGQPPIVLRLVVIHNGRHPVYLVTTVLDERRLSDRQVIEMYRRRWGIELFYRHVKQTYELRKLRSRAADNAPIEAEWALLGLWAMALYAQCHLKPRAIPPSCIAMAGVLKAFRTPMREYKSRPDPGEDLHSLLDIAIIDGYQRVSKTSRDYPRKKQETAAGPPRIITATKAQIKKAREIWREMRLGLTA
jgi:hypothetical protein